MVVSNSDRGPDLSSSDSQGFIAALDSLKKSGCVVLVTGDVDATVRAATSRRLFGTSQLPRQRVVAHADDTALQLVSYLPHGICIDNTTVHTCELTSSVRNGLKISFPLNIEEALDQPTELVAYMRRLTEVIANTESTSKEFDPGELRVGILTLSSIFEQHGQTATASFLSSFGQRVRTHSGLGHCHLPVPSDSSVADTLANSVDIHVRLRERDGHTPEQCWHLCKTDYRSAWISISSLP
jgi:hypothetical protein